MLSIIVPTYNERENVSRLVESVEEALHNIEYEIVFVDDSTDDTPIILEGMARIKNHVRYIHRKDGRGLATAVILGFKAAKGNVLAVMDADLQHPPELLKSMYSGIKTGAGIVIPSRFIPGGDDGGLNPFRKFVSWTARMVGKLFLKKLRKFSDVTGGYFMFRKSVIKDVELNPTGWKILIEVLIRGSYENVIEIPYRFCKRYRGNSKMSIKEQLNYVNHIIRLAKDSSISNNHDFKIERWTLQNLEVQHENFL